MTAARFEVVDGLVVVPVVVWGPRGEAFRLRFVLDTGTSRTMLSEQAATLLGFSPSDATRRSRVSSVLGTEGGYMARASRIRALGWERDDVEVACHSFAPDAHVAGLLGADFFAGLRLVIDYGAGTVDLSESAARA
jgi:predicted aspartyl protease